MRKWQGSYLCLLRQRRITHRKDFTCEVMSYKVDTVDMSQFAVGQSGKIDLNKVKQKAGSQSSSAVGPAHLRIFNDSGSELGITSDDGSIDDWIPAGAWPVYELDQATSLINFNVIAVLPNPPVQLLLPTYFAPGEKVPDSPTLGNSPVGVGGSVTTSGQTLSNEANTTETLVIDIGQVGNLQLILIYSDGKVTWKVLQAGVAHTVFQSQTSGNPYLIGQAGDKSEVLGHLLADNDVFLANKKLSTSASGDLCDWSGAGVALAGNPSNHGKFFYQGDGTNTDWNIASIGTGFTGTGNGTFNHNCKQFGASVAPGDFMINPFTGTPPGSQTMGVGSITTTQVTVTAGAGLAWRIKAFLG